MLWFAEKMMRLHETQVTQQQVMIFGQHSVFHATRMIYFIEN
jgi:hypothetical protein